MAQMLAGKDKWYVVHVLSGQENKVRENILKRIKTEEMGDLVYEVLVPTERVTEIKKGKKSETTRKFFPGYLIVNMHLLDENNQLVVRTWYFIRETTGGNGFRGTKDKPTPMRQSDVNTMTGQANPAPPVGTALGPRGINIMAFCKEFNAATQKQAGDILPVVITVFKDKSFTFITKSPPAAILLKKAANIAAGSKEPNKEKVG